MHAYANQLLERGLALERPTTLEERQLDELPYGVVVIDNAGTVVSFKREDSMAKGVARSKIVGKNFFRDVAPGFAQIATFAARFKQFLEEDLNEIEPFEYLFPFSGGAQRVSILFVRDDSRRNRISIFMNRAEVHQ